LSAKQRVQMQMVISRMVDEDEDTGEGVSALFQKDKDISFKLHNRWASDFGCLRRLVRWELRIQKLFWVRCGVRLVVRCG
jgi:hypothetical protein